MAMTDPDILTDAIIASLQSIDALVTSDLLRAGAQSIIAYKTNMEEGFVNIEDFVLQQDAGTIVVFWRGTRTGIFDKKDTIKHDFGISLKPNGRASQIFTMIREGVCAVPEGRKFKLTQVTTDVRPPEDMACTNRSVYIAGNFGVREFSDITFTLTERGIDN